MSDSESSRQLSDRSPARMNSGSLGRATFSPSSSWSIPQNSPHHDLAPPERTLSGSFGVHWAASPGPAVIAASEPSSSSMMGMLTRTTMVMSREGSVQRDLCTFDERCHDNSPGNAANMMTRRASMTDYYHSGHDNSIASNEHPPPIYEHLSTVLTRHASFGGGTWNGLGSLHSRDLGSEPVSESTEAHQVVFAHDAVKVVHRDRALIYSRIPNPDGDEPVLQLETVRYNRGEMLRKALKCIRGTQRFEGLLNCMASFPRWGGLVAGPALAAIFTIGFKDTPERTEMQVAGVLAWMAMWWLLEVVPVAVTALLPALLWPILGVMSAEDVASCYCNDAMSLIFGTFIMSVAVQRWGLDKRLAVLTVTSIGQRPRMLLAAVMGLTTFLGCLMSNTATATMMMPLVVAMVLAPNAHNEDPEQLPATYPTPIPEEPETAGTMASSAEPLLQRTPSIEKQRPDPEVAKSYLKGMILATAYTCSISGFSTLTGTGPNLTFAGVWYAMSGEQVGWFQWLMFGLPLALSIEVFLFVIINVVYLRAPTAELAKAINLDGLIRDRNALPPVRGAEVVVILDYAVCIFLWITRKINIGSFNGWHEYLPDVGNGTVALLCTLFLFVCPAKGVRSEQGGDAGTQGPRVMDWDAAKTIKWSTLILISGGFALSAGVTASGLDRLIAEAFSPLEALPNPITLLATISLVVLITDWLVSSNVAVATLTLPILGTVAEDMGLHKLALMIPATIACSLSFCSPVATPPNAIAFSTGLLKISEMVKTGACVATCAIVMTWCFSMTIGGRIFDYSIWR